MGHRVRALSAVPKVRPQGLFQASARALFDAAARICCAESMVRPRLLRITSRTIAQVAVVHEKEAAIDLDLDLLRRRGKQVAEGGWGKSVEGRCCCAQGMHEGF